MLSFTTGTVFGGLTAASLFCTVFGEDDLAEHYQQVASEIRDAASEYLWNPETNRFCRMISRDENGNLVYEGKIPGKEKEGKEIKCDKDKDK